MSAGVSGHEALSALQLHDAYHYVQSSDPGSVGAGKNWLDTSSSLWIPKRRNATDTGWVIVTARLDQVSPPTADVSLAGFKLINVANPSSAQDAATKTYVDSLAVGLSWKSPVRAASTANGTLATAFENGDTLDGVTLATGDRILLKDQTAGAENGIYTVNASGAPTRATDADSAAEVLQMTVLVEEGTANADTGWICTTDAPITLNTTALVFVKFTPVAAGSSLTVEELDGSPTDSSITKIIFPNGTLSISTHEATYTPAGGGAGTIVIEELDGTPTNNFDTLKFPNGTLTDNGDGSATYTPAGGGGGDTLIDEQIVTGATQASFDTTSISGSYRALRIVVLGAGDHVSEQDMMIRFNNDSGANYDWNLLFVGPTGLGGVGHVEASGASSGRIGNKSLSGETNIAATTIIDIPFYARTTFFKSAISRGNDPRSVTSGGNYYTAAQVLWKSTSAITRVTVLPKTGNFVTGSVYQLYGVS